MLAVKKFHTSLQTDLLSFPYVPIWFFRLSDYFLTDQNCLLTQYQMAFSSRKKWPCRLFVYIMCIWKCSAAVHYLSELENYLLKHCYKRPIFCNVCNTFWNCIAQILTKECIFSKLTYSWNNFWGTIIIEICYYISQK